MVQCCGFRNKDELNFPKPWLTRCESFVSSKEMTSSQDKGHVHIHKTLTVQNYFPYHSLCR